MSTLVELHRELEQAFADRRHPGAERVTDRPGQHPNDEESRVAAFFAQRDWRHVTREALETAFRGQARSVIFLLSREAFQYFLPAFLSIALDLDRGLDVADGLSFALTLPKDEVKEGVQDVQWFRERVETLTPAEKRAVAHVLRSMADRYPAYTAPDNPARVALESYWERAAV